VHRRNERRPGSAPVATIFVTCPGRAVTVRVSWHPDRMDRTPYLALLLDPWLLMGAVRERTPPAS